MTVYVKLHECRKFIADVTTWARPNKLILGVVLVGSYANGTAHEESDIDVVIVTVQPGAESKD